MTLQRALIALITVALLAGLVPAGLALDHWLRRELEGRVREELAQAPRLLADRSSTISSAMMMYAKDVASAPGLAEAVSRRDRTRTLELLEEASAALKAQPVLQLEDGELWAGPPPSSPLVEATRRGEMPVRVVCDGETLRMFALAPLEQGGDWLGAAGVVAPWDETMAGTLAGLTRSDLVLLGTKGAFVATEAVAPAAAEMIRRVEGWPADGEVRELQLGARRYLVAIASVDDATILFLRDMQRELAVRPKLRLITVSSGVVALALALVLGSLLAVGLARPVRALAAAADRLATGDFDAPLAASPIQEVERVTHAFDAMRRALAARLEELEAANRELGERQARLTALQWELLRRERLAVSGRLVAQLAHEIRNPVASVRNCLELVHRRLRDDPEGQEFAEMAIHELLRMHELAERMLDL
ncbi:MAG: histidine kinase dimerization/phospho-acceptor domain-containing protein, partial [Longimicrobiaceae bacterium]